MRINNACWFFAMSGALLMGTAHPAQAQIWFNGGGVSAGGGPMHFRDANDTPLATLIRPTDDTTGAFAGGLFLSLGSRRWAVILPELHYYSGSPETNRVDGTLTLGSTTAAFEATSQSIEAFAMLVGAQAALVPSGRVWVRGGIGEGWMSSRIEADDQGVGVDLSDGMGLALSAALGVSLWTRPVGTGGTMSVDAEVHYLRIRSDNLRVGMPSVRVGFRVQPFWTP